MGNVTLCVHLAPTPKLSPKKRRTIKRVLESGRLGSRGIGHQSESIKGVFDGHTFRKPYRIGSEKEGRAVRFMHGSIIPLLNNAWCQRAVTVRNERG